MYSLQSLTNSVNKLSQVFRVDNIGSVLYLTSENGMETAINSLPSPIFVLSVMEAKPMCLFPKSVVSTKFVQIDDEPDEDLLAILKPCTKWINNALQTPNAQVIVHCVAGISRSASVVVAYLMEYYDFSLSKALRFVKDTRTIIDPNEGFRLQLAQYETRLKEDKMLL